MVIYFPQSRALAYHITVTVTVTVTVTATATVTVTVTIPVTSKLSAKSDAPHKGISKFAFKFARPKIRVTKVNLLAV
jgi:hypothetical protein